MDIGGWLRSLGLGRYEAVFRESEIEPDVLAELTEQHLKDLGVSLGHRLKMLRAIRELASDVPDKAQPTVVAEPNPHDAAERRQLTVMFCDLVGSTALSVRLDPEDMREVIRAYQDACSGVVARYEGFVAKFMGDGILAYFGFPRAHEDDAARAVHAGLELVEVVAGLKTPAHEKLAARIGVATGIVVVGDLVGQGSAREQAVVGETPNLAARLQALAEPSCVVVADSTRRLLGATFELKALGVQTLKGFDTPIAAWAVLCEAENLSRFEASRSHGLTPFVGREREIALLLDRWQHASDGEGQIALLSGEAGIGKSRLLAALRERIGDEPHVALRYQCSPHHVDDAFYPIASQIWHAAGFIGGEPAAARLDKLESMTARSGLAAKEIAPFLATLLSVAFEGRYPQIEMPPSELKERTIAALISLFETSTHDAPVLALLEDAHWIDPSSLDLFTRLIDRLSGLRAMLVVTFRPEFTAPWLGRSDVVTLEISRFGRRQSMAMIEQVTGGNALPREVLEQVIAKTDGVPLFVEELTKTLLESGLLRAENGAYVLASAVTPLAIPSTLQDSLMARLDRLASVKEIAQIGAAIGREFSYRLLEAVSPIVGPALQDALRQLIASELIHGQGAPPDATYVFNHALVQDAAYASLLRGRRQRIHADLARALSDRFADQIDAAPAIIAHHYSRAGLTEPAVRSWLAAAELSLSRSANAEADHYVDAGLAEITRLAEGPDRQFLELSLQLARANALLPLRGQTAPETVAALTAAKRGLDAGVGTDLQRFSVLFGLCLATFAAARMEPSLALARQLVDVADRHDDPIYRLVGYRVLGMIQVYMGQSRAALESLRRAEQYRDPDRQTPLINRFATDPNLAVLCWKILALIELGHPDQAVRVGEQALAELAGHEHGPTVAMCILFALIWPKLHFGDLDACERHSAELIAHCAEKRVGQYRVVGAIFLGCARAMREPTGENIAAYRAAIDAHHGSGAHLGDTFFVSMLAEASLAAGDVKRAEAALKEAYAYVESSGERYRFADLHRIDGKMALKRSEPDRARAEACFLQAIEVARSEEARMLELRAATDLARLWRDMGSPNDFRALLEPILAAIEGGEATRDVRNARALLAEVA